MNQTPFGYAACVGCLLRDEVEWSTLQLSEGLFPCAGVLRWLGRGRGNCRRASQNVVQVHSICNIQCFNTHNRQ